MKIKVKDLWYNSEEIPIMLVFENNEKELISSMDIGANKFASFPDNMVENDVKKFMEI